MNVRLTTTPHRIVIELGGEETVIDTAKALELYRQLGIALAESERDATLTPHVSKLYVLENDEDGDLFLARPQTCAESHSPVVLDEMWLWFAYVIACREMNRARRAVIDALKIPGNKANP